MKWLISAAFLRNSIISRFPPRIKQFISLKAEQGNKPSWQVSDCLLDTVTGYVFDSSGRFLAESSSWEPQHALSRMPARPAFPVKPRQGKQFLFLGAESYYHWLLEDFPSYLRARNASSGLITGIRMSSPKYVYEALNLLGVKPQVLPLFCKISQLTISSKSSALNPAKIDIRTLEKLVSKIEVPPSSLEMIYISRRESGRYPENEDVIEELVRGHGFDIIELSQLPFLEQIALFKNAKFIMGTHGAGLANLVWGSRGQARVVEIARTDQPDCFEQIAVLKEQSYSRLDSPSGGPWLVDLSALDALLSGTD